MRPIRRSSIAGATRAACALAAFVAPVAHAQVQPKAAVAIFDSARMTHAATTTGAQPLDTAMDFSLGGCTASAHAAAGVGTPFATALTDSVRATNQCGDAQPAMSGTSDADAGADGVLVYKVKGPGAVAPPFAATLSEHLHGTLSTTSGLANYFGAPTDHAILTAIVYQTPSASSGSYEVSASASDGAGGPQFYPSTDIAPFFDSGQSTATSMVYAIDHVLQQPESLTGYVETVRFRLECEAPYDWQVFGVRTAAASGCDFDSGDTSVSLDSDAASVVFERVAPVKATTPRSAAYLSPAAAPLQTFPGTPGIPTTASGSGDLGQGASGGGSASADLPLASMELLDSTGAASQIDQSAVTADTGATVATEGQGAASLLYHVTFLNGATLNDYSQQGLPLSVQVPSVNATLSATKGLDPSIVEQASFEITIDAQGAPLFHFVTLELGSSNESPPGLSGDLRSQCFDASTATAQVCAISTSLNDQALGILPDPDGNVVLTVQTDCATSLAHPSGPLLAAHVACDAGHTVTAKLISRDANVVLTAVPEPDASALAIAAAGALAALRKRARGAC